MCVWRNMAESAHKISAQRKQNEYLKMGRKENNPGRKKRVSKKV